MATETTAGGMQPGAQPTELRAAHPYHMYDAIHQQPERIARLLRDDQMKIDQAADAIASRERILLVGIGSSYHAAQIGAHFLRHLSGGRIRALLEQSFELVNYPLALGRDDALIAISHRGWKNYSVQALRAARAAGALTIAVTGRDPGEAIRAADFVLLTCEQELSFTHTKSYTTALAALAALALRVAEQRGLATDPAAARTALEALPQRVQQALSSEGSVQGIARQVAARSRLIFIGAGPNWATAREAALKVKETCYMATEGFETEQFLHGPLAEVDARAALVALLADGPGDERAREALRAAEELGALRVAVVAEGVKNVPAEHRIEAPHVPEWLSPFVQVVPLQFLSYFLALERGANPDTGRQQQPAHARAQRHFKL